MSLIRKGFLVLSLWLVSTAVFAQTIFDQIETNLDRSAVANNVWSVLVQNQSGTKTFYYQNEEMALKPASNTKMYTTAGAFGLLGPLHSFVTSVYVDGTINGSGTLSGDIILLGNHDFTWSTRYYSSARIPLDQIAQQCYANGLRQVTGKIRAYGVCLYQDAISNQTAADQFKSALQNAGISVPGGKGIANSGFNPPGTLYTSWASIPLEDACKPLNKSSVNVYTDVLLRHIGYEIDGSDTYAAGAVRVNEWLRSIGIETADVEMQDGSGLSHNNRYMAHQTLNLVRYMLTNFPTWDDTLSIGCVDGTLASRFCGTVGAGNVHGKTGTLSGVIALSGYIDNLNDGQKYLFSFMAGNVTDNAATQDAMDDSIVLLGGAGVGSDPVQDAHPPTPRMILVKNNGTGDSITVRWSDVGPVTRYNLYASSDGVSFESPIFVASGTTSYTENGLSLGATRYYKVTAVGASAESKASDVYGAKVSDILSRVLIVDGNDRWVTQSENPNADNHDFAAITGRAIAAQAFDTADNATAQNNEVSLASYDSVVWTTGEESTLNESFNSQEQAQASAYLNSGGSIFASGAEIGWDLDANGSSADVAFYNNYLKQDYAGDDAATYDAFAETGGLFDGVTGINFSGGAMNIDFPDYVVPFGGSTNQLFYTSTRKAATSFDGAFKVITFGFPFESINNATVRQSVMDRALSFLLNSTPDTTPPAAPAGLTATPGDSTVSLNWNDNTEPDLAGYNVYRSTTSGGSYTQINGSLVTASAYADNTVANGVTYYYVVTAVDTSSNESSDSNEASATPQSGGCTATAAHVSSIVLITENVGGGNKRGRADVTIVDNCGNPVSSANVTGNFSGSYNEVVVAATGANGVAILRTTATVKGAVAFTFCVDNVAHSTLGYDSGANVETCDVF